MAKKKRGGKGRFKSKRALSAQIGLGSLINQAKADDRFRNEPASTSSVIKDMPERFQKFIANNLRPDGTMNSAAQAIFNQYDDGRSEFQRELNRNIQSNPFFAQAYEQRFPITSAIQKFTPAVVGAAMGIPLGLGTVYNEARKLGSNVVGGLKDIAINKGIIPRNNINPDTGTTSVRTDVINPAAASRVEPSVSDNIFTGVTPTDPQPGQMFTGVPPTDPRPGSTDFTGVAPTDPRFGSTMFTGATPRDPQPPRRFTGATPTDPPAVQQALPTDVITEGLKSLFTGATPRDPRPVREQFSSTFQQPFDPPMIPGGIPRGSLPVREGRLLGQDPNVAYGQELSLLDIIADNLNTRGFQEGGLASINNPQYNMLMNASDFDI